MKDQVATVQMKRLLLAGPMLRDIGGDAVKFTSLVNEVISCKRYDAVVVDTSRERTNRWIRNPIAALRVLIQLAGRSVMADMMVFHASNRGMATLGPAAWLLARATGKPLVIRLFGGSFDRYYLRQSRARRWLLKRTILSAEVCLFQTRHLVRFFTRAGARRVEWLANYSELPVPPKPVVRGVCRRLVFLGQVRAPKGIDVILESAAFLPADVTIDIYGPLYDISQEDIERGTGRVRYRGILTQDEVTTRLWDYDALLLPTTHDGEGYPGVIVEAFAHGLPVITTRWMSIPELVDETCGILIPPRNATALADAIAILHSDPDLYKRLGDGALNRAQLFSTDIWIGKFLDICDSVLVNSPGKRDLKCAAS